MSFAKTTRVIACVAAVLLGGCGSSDDGGRQIPAATRQELDKQLRSVENRFDAGGGACSDIAQNQDSVQRTLESIPADVDAEVRNALRDGFDRLFQLTAEQCDEQKNQKTETETETTEAAPAPSPQPEPTPTVPTPTETTPAAPEKKPEKEKEKEKGKKDSGSGGTGGGNVVPQAGDGGGGTVSP